MNLSLLSEILFLLSRIDKLSYLDIGNIIYSVCE